MYVSGYSRGTSYGLRGHHEPSSAAGDGQYWGSGYAGEPYGALSPGVAPASAQAFGFEVIPENDPMTFGSHGDHGAHSQRQAEAAVQSWRVGQVPSSSLASGLSLSARSSDVDLKEFLVQRGNHPLEGLHRAAAQGDRAAIMHLMKMMGPSAAIDGLDANGCSPLMYAVMADSTLAVEMLLNFRAHREQVDPEGRTAVHYAAFFGKHKALKFLIESASDWTPRDAYGRTPLHWACASKSTRGLQILLTHARVVFGDIDPRDSEGMTPLHVAAHSGRPRHIAILSEAECDFTAVDIEQMTPLHWTAGNSDSGCIQALMEAYPPLLNKRDINGSTILHLTASKGSTLLVDTLLRMEGVVVNARDNLERTPLHYACIEDRPAIVRLLLEFRALDSCIDGYGYTSLHYAVQTNSVISLQSFARLPEVTHLPDINEGKTPLMVAAQNGLEEAIQVLLSNPVIAKSVNQVDVNGRSALHLAAQTGSAGCISLLLSKGADPNLCDSFQQTPLFPACEGGHAFCVETLIGGGCQPNVHDQDGQAALHKAVLANQPGAVQALARLRGSVDLNMLDINGNTAIHMACYGGSEQILGILLEGGASTSVQDPNGLSPVHYAAMEGHLNCLSLLLTFHAYVNFMDFSDNKHTPVDYAKINGHSRCEELLSKAGGVSVGSVRELAAISIQAAFRGYRARRLRSELSQMSRAVTVITAHFRGYRERQRYRETKRRQLAATTIQAFVRGHLQRCKFKDQISMFREQERNRNLMEEFARKLMSEQTSLFLQSFTDTVSVSEDVLEGREDRGEVQGEGGAEEEEYQQKLRLESAMKMREIYEEKQRLWLKFREAERQRRINKANQEELDRLAGVLAQSRGRRAYAESKFLRTRMVRSCNEAAIIIQRAFRRVRWQRSWLQRKLARDEALRMKREHQAALVIQLAWRRYRQAKLYETLHFRAIYTSPVIALPRQRSPPHTGILPEICSYQRNTSITGYPRRKVHLTEQSGFKVFRPRTRDLLLKEPIPQASAGTKWLATRSRQVKGLENPVHKAFFEGSKSSNSVKGDRSSGGLPELFPKYPQSRKPKDGKSTFHVHLPEIVLPS